MKEVKCQIAIRKLVEYYINFLSRVLNIKKKQLILNSIDLFFF